MYAPAPALSPLPIEQRDIDFALGGARLSRWHSGGALVTHVFNALSQFFPEGEKFFIESVRHYRDRISDPVLLQQVQGFIGQEAMHGREHRAYNQALAAEGYPIARLEQRVIDELRFTRRLFGPRGRLAATIALEHLTAILANQVLRNPQVLAGADPRVAALWRWHAVEETEHKAVAFDVYRHVMPRSLGSYLVRVGILVSSTLRFIWLSAKFHRIFCRHDPERAPKGSLKALLRFLFTSPGVVRRVTPDWLAYFKPGFHPWQHDNRAQVEAWKAALAADGAPPG